MTPDEIKRLGEVVSNEIRIGVEKAQREGIPCKLPVKSTLTIDGEDHEFRVNAIQYAAGKASEMSTSADHALTSVYEAEASFRKGG